MITVGVDVGSLYTKVVVVRDDDPVAANVVPTTGNIAREIPDMIETALARAGVTADDVESFGATGSGADLVPGADFTEDEVTCAAAAAAFYLPGVKMAINMGGQSIASVRVGPEGQVLGLMRNDKCASGSGKVLEAMSGKLGVELATIDEVVAGASDPVTISNQCGVFVESELISHANDGRSVSDILAGVCLSVADMIIAQGRRFGETGDYTLVGGVARCKAVVARIGQKLPGNYIAFPFDPTWAPALGAALLTDEE